MVLEPGGGLSFPLPPGSGSTASGGSLLAPARLFQRATPVFPFHLTGWPPHHPVLGQVQSQVQQSMQAQHQAAAAAVRYFSHHHPHHPHPALGNHPLVPTITGHHPAAHNLHHNADHGDEDDEKKARRFQGYPYYAKTFYVAFLSQLVRRADVAVAVAVAVPVAVAATLGAAVAGAAAAAGTVTLPWDYYYY
ncbi:hypothetical protein M0802_006251 [Mischocyttarus mexicanus]|nr:hypothetical protein M0802_006251 [Mischocyttarus mexicanus]